MPNDSETEQVAQAFREAVEDLQNFNKNEINTLTMIARENTEHAYAISVALQEHIKRVVPQKKLGALYLLDSIVKNVGTPYTIYFSKKLYQTFMDAYASVDLPTRRKMDEMLRTWKERVPESMNSRPVFPVEVTRPIENALIKARTVTLQKNQRDQVRGQPQMHSQGRPQGMPYRETPTPPGSRLPQYNGYPPNPVSAANGSTSYNNQAQPSPAGYPLHPNQPQPARSTPQPLPSTMAFQPPQMGGYGVPQTGISVDALNDDIQRLITAFKAQVAQTPHDPSVQTRLKALVDLQTILQTQNLPQDQLVLVKKQIADLAVTIRAPPIHTTTPTPVPQSVAVAPPPVAAPTVSIDSLLGPGALAAIMARNSGTPKASAPQIPPPVAAVPTRPPQRAEAQRPIVAQHMPAPPPPSDPMALMNMLRQAGLISATTPANNATPVSRPAPSIPFPLPINIPGMVPVTQPIRPTGLEALTNDIMLRPASLKQFRPHLLPFLFESLGPQCTQCGRRFPKSEEGKKKKTAHMDWHFRVNQRIAESEKRGQHRSWLVDDVDWIKTRETVDTDHIEPASDPNAAAGSSASKAPELQYIPVPDDPSLANSVCSICQEKFETRWLDDAQEFVWPDATKVGGKIYHASCYREAYKDGGNTPVYARGTPEPESRKRKAEQDELASSSRSKVKVEGA